MWKKINPKQVIYWLIIAILLLILIYLLILTKPFYAGFFSFMGKLLLPFLIAGIIAYLLHPLIERLYRFRIPRGIAVGIIYLLFFGGTAFLLYRTYPLMVKQVTELSHHFPQFISLYQEILNKIYTSTSFLPESFHDRIDAFILSIENSISTLSGSVIGSFNGMIDKIIFLTVIPVLVFYFLKDYTSMHAFFIHLIPRTYREKTATLLKEMSKGLGGYIRGQIIISSLVGVISMLFWLWLGIPYALLLGFILAIVNLIPYFGPIIGAIPVTTVAYTISPEKALLVIVIIFIIQLIESNLLSPYIMGKTVKIHPVGIIFILLLGGQLAGVIGMIASVPLFTMLKVAVQQYRLFQDRKIDTDKNN